MLASAIGSGRHRVNSVHRQGTGRLGSGSSCGAAVPSVQWHPEWNVACDSSSRAFPALLSRAVRGDTLVR